MTHQHFSIRIILRVALIVGNVFLLAWIFGDDQLFFNQVILSAILAGQVGELIHFVNHTNRELTRFFLAIRHADFSVSFRENHFGKSFQDLNNSFGEIIESFRKVKIEKEVQYQFLKRLVEQIHIGIVSLDGTNITLINSTAEELLNLHRITNWQLLHQQNPVLAKEIEQLGDNGRKPLEARIKGESKIIAVDVSTLVILDKPYKLITLQDINSEIEQKEIEAWHKLIRILTHEIMNSVTPISSLTETMQDMLITKSGTQKTKLDLSDETISDIRFSLNTIQKRSDGLLDFVENYRKFSRIPKPVMQPLDATELLLRIQLLMKEEMQRKNISFHVHTHEESLPFTGDAKLIEQVIINLITNSIHALDQRVDKNITITSFRKDQGITIQVTDNGVGIPAQSLNEIFIPFFSTRKEGSGIGLSLSKQIMTLHHGTIKVSSEPGIGATFYLYFKTIN
ncbi:MAG TPA: ATP-binding protein [Ohtaekwangia sp.]|nr:ATP-binding protein [Ohtaekwangia sp.]